MANANSGRMHARAVDIINTLGIKINPSTEEKQDDAITELQTLIGLATPVLDTSEFFEDTNFVAGDSPVILDLNTALGRNSTTGHITNDGAGNFTYAESNDGVAFGDEVTLKPGETDHWEDISLDSMRITHIADSAYRIKAI